MGDGSELEPGSASVAVVYLRGREIGAGWKIRRGRYEEMYRREEAGFRVTRRHESSALQDMPF